MIIHLNLVVLNKMGCHRVFNISIIHLTSLFYDFEQLLNPTCPLNIHNLCFRVLQLLHWFLLDTLGIDHPLTKGFCSTRLNRHDGKMDAVPPSKACPLDLTVYWAVQKGQHWWRNAPEWNHNTTEYLYKCENTM